MVSDFFTKHLRFWAFGVNFEILCIRLKWTAFLLLFLEEGQNLFAKGGKCVKVEDGTNDNEEGGLSTLNVHDFPEAEFEATSTSDVQQAHESGPETISIDGQNHEMANFEPMLLESDDAKEDDNCMGK